MKYLSEKLSSKYEMNEAKMMLSPQNVTILRYQKNVALHKSVLSPLWIIRIASELSEPSLPGNSARYQRLNMVTSKTLNLLLKKLETAPESFRLSMVKPTTNNLKS